MTIESERVQARRKKSKKKEDKPITAQPVGETYTTLAKGSVQGTVAMGHGVFRRLPTCKD